MSKLKPYDAYKETGLFWLDKIPSHWRWLYLSQVCMNQQIKNHDNLVTNVLSLSYGNIVRKKNIDFGLVPKEYNTYQIVNPGNIIMRLTDLQNDKKSLRTGLVRENGIITSAYTCLATDSNSEYIHYLLHSFDTFKVFYGMGGGVRQSIGYNDIRRMQLPIPSKDEQDQIVRYLNSSLAKISKFIKAKKKLMEKLKEQKEVIINQAVTKGLDPNTKFKPSGIDWLGDIPEGWKVVQLRRLTKTVKTGGTPQGASEKYYAEDGFNWFTPSDFNDNLFLGKSIRQLSNLGVEEVTIFPKNSILMIGIGGTMGKVSVSKGVCSCNQQINAIICNELADVKYLAYYLRAMKKHIFDTAKYTTLPILNQEETKKIPVLSFSVDIQKKIVDYVESQIFVIDRMIATAKTEIDLITEYRTRLISDVVTGKVDVRGIVVGDVLEELEEVMQEESLEEISEEEEGEE